MSFLKFKGFYFAGFNLATINIHVVQDFEALTPNLLARTVETVEGGGIVCLLLRTMNSLKKLYTLNMVSPSANCTCICMLCIMWILYEPIALCRAIS